MTMRLPIAVSLISLALETCVVAVAEERPSFAGLWKGTSVWQIKNSPCRDEGAVYTVKKSVTPDSFEFSGNKVVDGQETFMSLLECSLGSETGSLICRQGDTALWTWKLDGDSMSGTLMFRGQLYRKIELTRAK